MFSSKRVRLAAAGLLVAATSGGIAAAMITTASASPRQAGAAVSVQAAAHGPKLSLERFDLNGYVINAAYSLGRNTGNTFQQTYQDSTVQGVPIEGPFVGTTFPPEDYVAIPIGHHELYIAWLDPQSFAIVDAFVMNFASHTVYDYAPGGDHPESAGTITVVHRGAHPLP